MNKNYSKMSEIGKSGVEWSQYGQVTEEFLSELQGINGIATYREMSDNDAIIGACLFAIKQILREVRWSVKAYDESSIGTQRAEFLRENMNQMSLSWNDMIMDALSMLIYGWSWHEVVYKRDSKGFMRWKKIAIRLQGSWKEWSFDTDGVVDGLIQAAAPNYKEIFIPLLKSILFRTQLNGDNPEGRSILRNAYRSWYFKKNIEEIEAIGIERDLAGIPVITLPEGFDLDSEESNVTDAIIYAKKLVANIRADEQDGIVLPFGWKFELISSPGKKQFDTGLVIGRLDKGIAASVLAEFILLGMERTGSYALSKDLTDIFFWCLDGWCNGICSVVNRFPVKQLFQLNGVVDNKLPRVVSSVVHKYTLTELCTYVSTLSGANALVIDEDLQKYLKRVARLQEFQEVD